MNKNFLQKNFIYTTCSALLFYFSFPNFINPQGFSFLAWICLIPLFFVLDVSVPNRGQAPIGDRHRLGTGILWGSLFGWITYLLIVNWVFPISILGYLTFVFTLALQPVFFALFFRIHRTNTFINLFYLPSLWVFTEYLRSLLLGGFSWTLGFSQSFFPPMIQIADVTGTYGVSFVIVLVNVCLFQISQIHPSPAPISDPNTRGGVSVRPPLAKGGKNALFYICSALGIVFIVWCYGMFTISENIENAATQQFSVCSLQPNISVEDKSNPELLDETADQHIALSQQCWQDGKRKPDLIVWPETAIVDDIIRDEQLNEKITAMVKARQTHLLVGSALLDNGKSFNSAVFFNPQGEVRDVYHKKHLVPFMEYGMTNNTDFEAGKRLGVFTIKHANQLEKFGVAICSEEVYPALFRGLKQNGVGFIISMLNDGWSKRDEALMTHAQGAIMHAAAFKVPIIRSTNTGFSTKIDSYGRISQSTIDTNTKRVFKFSITPHQKKTFYSKFGDVFAFLCGTFVLIVLIPKNQKTKRTKR